MSKSGVVLVQVLNLTDSPITINKATPVVQFSALLGVADSGSLGTPKVPSSFEDSLTKVVDAASITDEQKAKLKEFLMSYKDVFSEPKVLSKAKVVPHKINTSVHQLHHVPIGMDVSRIKKFGRRLGTWR